MSPQRKPVHPGEFLREEFLEEEGITQAEIAEALGLNRVTVSKILNARQKITPDVALRLSKCLSTSAEVWLNMQTKYDLWQEEHNKRRESSRAQVKKILRG